MLLALIELGVKSGARCASLTRIRGQNIDLVRMRMRFDTGLKEDFTKMLEVEVTEDMPCMQLLLQRELRPAELLFPWSVSRISTIQTSSLEERI